MPDTRISSVTVTPDLRISSRGDVALTPVEALQFAEQVTLAAMLRQAALMPARRSRRSPQFIAGNLASAARKVLAA